jgi:hypothetical protein
VEARFHGPNHADARSVALACLEESRQFVQDMHSFMSDFYLEMVATSGVEQAAEAWTLTCKIIGGIFYQLHLVRSVAAGAHEVGTVESGKRIGLVVWGSPKAHKMMREFQKESFRRHPTVAATLMLHAFSSKTPAARIISLRAEMAEIIKASKLVKVTADKALEMATKNQKK